MVVALGRSTSACLCMLVFLMSVHVFGASGAAPMDVPVEIDVQVPILLNVLSFDRNLKQRVGSEVVLGVLFQEKFRQSLDAKNQVASYLKKSRTNRIDSIPLRVVFLDLLDTLELKLVLEKEKINILYIAPLRAVSVAEIAMLSQSLKITSLTGIPEYCELGIVVGVGSKGGNPLIIINLAAANASGNDFSSRLLKLAKVINHNNRLE